MSVNPTMTDDDTQRLQPEDVLLGPFTGYNRYGQPDHTYYRCPTCTAECVSLRDFMHKPWCPERHRAVFLGP